MKKAMALMLIVGIVMSMAGTALAETVQSVGLGKQTHEVTATYEAGETGGTVISIDIDWNDLDFTYFAGSEQVWDPVTHTYSGETVAAGWRGEGNITVTNHSNAFLDVSTVTYAPAEGYGDADMEFGFDDCKGRGWIYSAEVNHQAQSGVISVTPTGTLPEGTQEKAIGTITLTIQEMKDVSMDELGSSMEACWTTYELLEEAGTVPEDELAAFDAYITAMNVLHNSLHRDFYHEPITPEEQIAINQVYIDGMGMAEILGTKYLS